MGRGLRYRVGRRWGPPIIGTKCAIPASTGEPRWPRRGHGSYPYGEDEKWPQEPAESGVKSPMSRSETILQKCAARVRSLGWAGRLMVAMRCEWCLMAWRMAAAVMLGGTPIRVGAPWHPASPAGGSAWSPDPGRLDGQRSHPVPQVTEAAPRRGGPPASSAQESFSTRGRVAPADRESHPRRAARASSTESVLRIQSAASASKLASATGGVTDADRSGHPGHGAMRRSTESVLRISPPEWGRRP